MENFILEIIQLELEMFKLEEKMLYLSLEQLEDFQFKHF